MKFLKHHPVMSFVNGRPIGHSSCRPSCATARARSFPSFGMPRVRAAFLAFLGLAAFASANAYGVTATKAYVDSRDAATLSAANAADASLSAYTTGVSNKVEAAQSAADANAAAIAAETKARESAGYLTAESDPTTGLTNYFPYVRGTEVARADWGCVKIGRGAFVMNDDYEIAIGANAHVGVVSGIAIGYKATPSQLKSTAIGYMATTPKSVVRGDYGYLGFSAPIDKVYFNSYKDSSGNYSDARSLQSYLDERATTNALAEVKAMISETNATFSSAVLQVGIGTLGITTNDLQVVHDLAELPVGTSITTVGGLLAALAAGLAALKKSVSSLSSKVDDANAALEEVA